MTKRAYTALHLFCGSGGTGSGFKQAGFHGVGAYDYDPRAVDDYARLTGEAATVCNLATVTVAEFRRLNPVCPDVAAMSSPCVGLSGCLSESLSKTPKYQDLNSLSTRGIDLLLETWKDAPTGRKVPGLIVFENVPRIKSRGRKLLDRIVALLQRSGYSVHMSSHICGELAAKLPQGRPRFLLVARHMATVSDFLRKPPLHKPIAIREALCELPRPRPDTVGMHREPALNNKNKLRLACIPAGGDWRDLPSEVFLYPCASGEIEHVTGIRWRHCVGRQSGKLGVLDWELPAKTIIGKARVCNTWNAVADPRVGWSEAGSYKDRPSGYGVADMEKPSATIRGKQVLVNSASAVVDPRLACLGENAHSGVLGVEDADKPAHTITGNARAKSTRGCVQDPRVGVDLPPSTTRKNGGFGVEDSAKPARSVLAEGSVSNTPASVQDPRLGCDQRGGAYGVMPGDEPAGTVVGHHKHDRVVGSVADPRLDHAPRRGSMGVMPGDEPATVIRGEHSVRQAAGAVQDPRLARAARAALPQYDERGWPVPTHELVRLDDGRLVLYGPALDWSATQADVVIRAPDGTCHRPLTDAELARLQGFPVGFEFCGPSSCAKDMPDGTPRSGRRKRIGNSVPPPTAYAIAQQCMATLIASEADGFRLASGDVWVAPEAEARTA